MHLLCSHPTPPAFDDGRSEDKNVAKPIDWNGRRNHDEIRFWAEYISGNKHDWIIDDQGNKGGLAQDVAFMICGDLNADPSDGDSFDHAINALLKHSLVNSQTIPTSSGALLAVPQRFQQRDTKTSDFHLRCDYVLPSHRDIAVKSSAVHWPEGDPVVKKASDHRAVWLEFSWKKQNNQEK